MTFKKTISLRAGGWTVVLLCILALTTLTASPAHAAANCSDYPGGVLDGSTGTPAPAQLDIDGNCTIKNYPNGFDTNISFFTNPGNNTNRWIVIFDNVKFTGQMACNSVAGNKIWFVNGSFATNISQSCQNVLIPVEKIDKADPVNPVAAIGVPFTYTLTLPQLFDAATGTIVNYNGSPNDIYDVAVTDDLNATGVDLSFVSEKVYWKDTGAPVTGYSFSNVGGVLSFDNFPTVPAGRQIVIAITVVLNDTPTNAIGTQFVNTAKWQFGRIIDGVRYEPLPGEWGISPPMTIGGPDLVLRKSGPSTMNLGAPGNFTLDVQNTGTSDAWNATVVDRLPNGATGGTCDTTPQILSAQVFAADGVTPVPGKGPLTPGIDFSVTYSSAPTCELTLTMLTAAGTIGSNERLIVKYATRLDPDSQNGATLTNVAGVTQWFNGASSNTGRVSYTRTLTDGTPGVLDYQDAYTVTVALSGLFFEKSVADLTSGANPAATAAPGDTLRYTLRLQTTDTGLSNASFYDDLGALNPSAVFVPGSLTLVSSTIPPGADVSQTNPNGGTNGAGILDIRNLSLPANSQVSIQFDIKVQPTLADGTTITNQANLNSGAVKLAVSDDPNVNGIADPNVAGDEDPTRVLVQAATPPALLKANTQATAAIGQQFSYRITVPSTPHTAPLYDVRVLDDLSASAADLQFVSVKKISGPGNWTPVNTGSNTNLVIEDPANGIDIPAGQQVVLEITVLLENSSTNVAGLMFTNTASYTYDLVDNDVATQRPGAPGTTMPMTVVEPQLTVEKSGPAQMRVGLPGIFRLNVHNAGGASAFGVTLDDVLPNTASGGMCGAAPSQITAQLFQADGVTAVAPPLTAGTDFSVAFSGSPTCTLELKMLTPAAAIGPDQRLIVTYQASLDSGTQRTASLTNIAGATQWFSADVSTANPQVRQYTRTLTDGTPGVLDYQDAHTVTADLPILSFEKTVADVTRGQDPGTLAAPGDTLRYTLTVKNLDTAAISNFSVRDELDRLNSPPAFAPGTLSLISVPAGADTSHTSATGGAAGTGLLDVRNLSLAAGASLQIQFEIVLAPVIANGSYVKNQSQLLENGVVIGLSDDPNINGPADPNVAGDDDPTQIQIESAPRFVVEKTSADMTGDPNVLLPGETLRYTITVKNVGNDNATDAVLRDQIPANTAYVAGSTTLNGAAVPDASSGLSPLSNGVLIDAPENPTPGAMRADASNTQSNVATIVFDVVVNNDVVAGTVISNQGFVDALKSGVSNQPSDDPRTPTPNDPTRNVVGNLPLLYSEKSVAIAVDKGSPNIVDPGDVLRYTIAVHNNGSVPATDVSVTDAVPANTTYVADSTTLNGLPVGQPDGGNSPLATGIPASSSDLTPPLPGPGSGTLSPGKTATIQFEVRVNDGVAAGTLISNQGVVHTKELPNQLTDGDGDPSTGPEPTVVVVGNSQQLSITKQVAVVGGGQALAGSTVEYTIRVANIAAVPALGVVITDNLDSPLPGQLTFVAQSSTMNGSTAGISISGSTLTADYSAAHGDLPPGGTILLRFRAVIALNLAVGTRVTNTAEVIWNDPQQSLNASASVSVDIGGTPGFGALNGTAWHDANFDKKLDTSERRLEGWTVELYRNGQLVHTTLTGADGTYRIDGLGPNDMTGDRYELRFHAPGAGPTTAALGKADSTFTNGEQKISDIVVTSGSNLQNLNLPIDPNGVVYNSVLRTPVAGARLTMLAAGNGAPLPTACFDDPAQQNQVTLADGYYKFDINFSDPACPSGSDYIITVTAPSTYVAGYSKIIPPSSDPSGQAFSVPGCPGTANDAIPATAEYCESQTSEFAPPQSVPARSAGTTYRVKLKLDDSQVPGSSEIFNNHIPLDPELQGALSISKTTPLVDVSRGQLVPYVITVDNTLGIDLQNVAIVDRFPAGFSYVKGSASLDGKPLEPQITSGELIWNGLAVAPSAHHTLKLLLAVGAGVGEGEFVNRAQVINELSGGALSGEASATVRIVPDPTFDCTDVMGKVFDDANRNGRQDDGEHGLSGVRLVTTRGLTAKTDAYGRFHIACAITPREDRGSNFVLKLDDRTLPSGYRASTDVVRIQRATRGKALRLNFGASVYRVVALDLTNAVFEPNSTEMRPQWKPRVGLLLKELKKAPSVLRLSYIADLEDPGLVQKRVSIVKKDVMRAWQKSNCCYKLTVETEVFWRSGVPQKRTVKRERKGG